MAEDSHVPATATRETCYAETAHTLSSISAGHAKEAYFRIHLSMLAQETLGMLMVITVLPHVNTGYNPMTDDRHQNWMSANLRMLGSCSPWKCSVLGSACNVPRFRLESLAF